MSDASADMGHPGLTVMDDEREHQEALAAAGYTSPRGALLFCLLLGSVGALLGSVVVAILWNMAVPGTSQMLSTIIGTATGGGLGVMLALLKVRQGNLEAREQVEDKQWRRLVRRQHGR